MFTAILVAPRLLESMMTSHRKMNIAVFFTHGVSLALWEKRGMFSRELKFYKELAREVGEVWLFTYGRHDEQYRDQLGDRIRLFPKEPLIPDIFYGLLMPLIFWRELKRADAIRIHQMAGAIPALLAHWMLRKPLIVRAGFQWYTFALRQNAPRLKLWFIWILEALAYRSARAIIHTTQHDADFVTKRYRVPPAKLYVIPNYVDTDLFKPLFPPCNPVFDSEVAQTRGEGAQRPKDLEGRICFVGRLEKQKNLLALVEAMQGLDARLVLYGEGSQREELETRARALGVDADFRGRIANDELPATLGACEIFVLPSFYEGNPKVLLEAMACGLPVVGSDVEGIASIITHEQTGLLCHTHPESIRQAIHQLLTDPALRARLGEAARHSILQSSSLEQAIRAEKALYAFL